MAEENDDTALAQSYPGIGRLHYALALIGLYIAIAASSAILAADSDVTSAIFTVLLCLFVFVGVQRFRNQGASGWWVLGYLVPFLNVYVSVRAFAYPEGYVAEGRLDRTGKIIATIYLVIVIGGILLAVALPAYQDYVQAVEAARGAN